MIKVGEQRGGPGKHLDTSGLPQRIFRTSTTENPIVAIPAFPAAIAS